MIYREDAERQKDQHIRGEGQDKEGNHLLHMYIVLKILCKGNSTQLVIIKNIPSLATFSEA